MQDRLGSCETICDRQSIEATLDAHRRSVLPRLERWWAYYRNDAEPVPSAGGDRRSRLAQERGLPARLTRRGPADDDRTRREVVIENDIAWRVHTMVDFLFGKPVRLTSTARDETLRRRIEILLDAAWEASGGVALLQDMALLGHVYGHVDLRLRIDEADLMLLGAIAGGDADEDDLAEIARAFHIEVIEATRGVPILDPHDYRRLLAYLIHIPDAVCAAGLAGATGGSACTGAGASKSAQRGYLEIIDAHGHRIEIDGVLVEERPSTLLGGTIPIAHIQNVSQPFRYEGLGEVEPLVPLQDELNTRLSDRASRVTMQTFKMYLARGIDGFDEIPVGPGQIWSTDNLDASIETFGGDASSPSEEAHIGEIREAMDKVSGVPPVASGVVRARIGNLSSANALRITLMGLLSKNARKRVTYGRGIEQISEMILHAVHHAGVLQIPPSERRIRLAWQDPLPSDIEGEIRAARGKLELGIDSDRVLGELGYSAQDEGVI